MRVQYAHFFLIAVYNFLFAGYSWTPINTVGFEDLQITSGWKTYPAVFSHHASDMIDYGWQAIQFNVCHLYKFIVLLFFVT